MAKKIVAAVETTGDTVVETTAVKTATPETTESVETAEVIETETETTPHPEQNTAVEIICSGCDDLNVDELKQVIDYCSDRIDELQREEVEALEAQMRAIQDKLMAMKGFRGKVVVENGEKQKRTDKVVVNPDNPNEIYRFGKTPDWLIKLMSDTGKTVAQLREEASKVVS